MSESFIHPTDVKYPFTDVIEDVKFYSLTEIARVIVTREENALDQRGRNPIPILDLLLFDPSNTNTSPELLRELFSEKHSVDETVRNQVLETLNSEFKNMNLMYHTYHSNCFSLPYSYIPASCNPGCGIRSKQYVVRTCVAKSH